MRLRGIDFGPVCNAAGARGFFGKGYPYHRVSKCLGLTFRDCSFVAKTMTLWPQIGNMPLKKDGITPREWKPSCLVVKPVAGVILNAVGLSNIGAPALLAKGRWQQLDKPFFLSFMSVGLTASDRLTELQEFVRLLLRYLRQGFRAQLGLEINFSCPNTGLDPSELIAEVSQALDVAAVLGIPLQVKFNATVATWTVCDIARHQACDAIVVSNTIPWGKMPHRIPWKELFGSDISPLARFGGGSLSGWPLRAIVCDWINEARGCGLWKPIWACGGIMSCYDVGRVREAGASGVQLGTVSTLRPWRMRGIIRLAHRLF